MLWCLPESFRGFHGQPGSGKFEFCPVSRLSVSHVCGSYSACCLSLVSTGPICTFPIPHQLSFWKVQQLISFPVKNTYSWQEALCYTKCSWICFFLLLTGSAFMSLATWWGSGCWEALYKGSSCLLCLSVWPLKHHLWDAHAHRLQ